MGRKANGLFGQLTIFRMSNIKRRQAPKFDIMSKLIYYVKYISENDMDNLQAYPSLTYELFKTAYENSSANEISTIEKFFCASEKMYSCQKEFIERIPL